MSTGFDVNSFSNDFNTKKYEDFSTYKADYGIGVKDYNSKLEFDYNLPKSADYNYSFEKKK